MSFPRIDAMGNVKIVSKVPTTDYVVVIKSRVTGKIVTVKKTEPLRTVVNWAFAFTLDHMEHEMTYEVWKMNKRAPSCVAGDGNTRRGQITQWYRPVKKDA